uniref:Wsv415-like protein n=1 Tax=Marsupenaeus japonicus endogenous nimavirus TaxID=2133793 RepID=A0A401IP77_9VIRU|nr:MAG: wsv415-like protein [Marsupenaeus japonicus endogenous nimavirus]GBG35401.1 wsv415-like protein [Marsupenaeus japonicus endogenous nimavirus]
MSFISLRLVNDLYNQRHRSLLYNHFISLPTNNDTTDNNFILFHSTQTGAIVKSNNDNNEDETSYDILAIDPLCPSDVLYIKVSIIDFAFINQEFLSILINTARYLNTKNVNFTEKCISPALQSLDTKTFRLSLKSFSELLRDHIFGQHLDRRKLIRALFEIPQLAISTSDIEENFFALDNFSKCILFLLYTHLLLECMGSSIRFRIEDIYTNEFINIKRKCHVSTSSDRIRAQDTGRHKQLPFVSDQFWEARNNFGKIIEYIIDPVIRPPKERPNNDMMVDNPLYNIIESVRSSFPDKNYIEKDVLYNTISIPVSKNNNNSENHIILNIRKEARFTSSNKQLLFPIHGRREKSLHFLNISQEAKVLLLLPYFFSNNETSCLFGDSILKDQRHCTFVLADFLPVH